MAGGGKTMALIGLGHDEDITTHFIDGVLYMSIGATATVEHVTGQLNKIMRVTGATDSASNVLSSTSRADAVTKAAIWFQGKRILFILDDIWPTSDCPKGYLHELQGLLRGNPESRIAISTRSLMISAHDGSRVDFGARDPRGPISTAMFMAHAALDMDLSESRVGAADCTFCGRIDSFYVHEDGAGVRVCLSNVFRRDCQPNDGVSRGFIFRQRDSGESVLEADYEKNGGLDAAYDSVSELYTSLCVMENQQIIPLPVLARMWNISETKTEEICLLFTSMSLAKISTMVFDGREQCVWRIHDLHLEYCRQNAVRSGDERMWHRRLLDGHMIPNVSASGIDGTSSVDSPLSFKMLEYSPRPW